MSLELIIGITVGVFGVAFAAFLRGIWIDSFGRAARRKRLKTLVDSFFYELSGMDPKLLVNSVESNRKRLGEITIMAIRQYCVSCNELVSKFKPKFILNLDSNKLLEHILYLVDNMYLYSNYVTNLEH